MTAVERRLKAAHETIHALIGRLVGAEACATGNYRNAAGHYEAITEQLRAMELRQPLLAGISNANAGERAWLKLIQHSEMTR